MLLFVIGSICILFAFCGVLGLALIDELKTIAATLDTLGEDTGRLNNQNQSKKIKWPKAANAQEQAGPQAR